MKTMTRAMATAAFAATAVAIAAGTSNAAPLADAAPTTAKAIDAPAPAPVDPGTAIDNAVSAVGGAFASANGDGIAVGGALGLAVGCPLGALTAGALTIWAPPVTPLAAIGGCLIGASGLSLLGGIAGSAINGFPAAINEANNQIGQLRANHVIDAPMAKPLPTAAPAAAPIVKPVDSAPAPQAPDVLGDMHTAWEAAGAYNGLGSGVGSTVGGLVGAAIGCPLGAATGGLLLAWTGPADLAAAAAGCVTGAVIVSGAGMVAGSLAMGIPLTVGVAVQKYNAIQAQRAAGTYNPSAG